MSGARHDRTPEPVFTTCHNAAPEGVTEPTIHDRFQTHSLKVVPPYWRAVASGDKTFEVRRNDRGYQRGDLLYLHEFHPQGHRDLGCSKGCRSAGSPEHYTGNVVLRWVTFVYSGDPRFGGIEPGHVVLGLGRDTYTDNMEAL